MLKLEECIRRKDEPNCRVKIEIEEEVVSDSISFSMMWLEERRQDLYESMSNDFRNEWPSITVWR